MSIIDISNEPKPIYENLDFWALKRVNVDKNTIGKRWYLNRSTGLIFEHNEDFILLGTYFNKKVCWIIPNSIKSWAQKCGCIIPEFTSRNCYLYSSDEEKYRCIKYYEKGNLIKNRIGLDDEELKKCIDTVVLEYTNSMAIHEFRRVMEYFSSYDNSILVVEQYANEGFLRAIKQLINEIRNKENDIPHEPVEPVKTVEPVKYQIETNLILPMQEHIEVPVESPVENPVENNIVKKRISPDEIASIMIESPGVEHVKIFYKNGKLTRDFKVVNGKRNGEFKEWYIDGETLKIQCNVVDDKIDGEHKQWYENGQLKSKINFVNGKKHGECKEWYDNGDIFLECYHLDDKKNGEYKCWDRKGKLTAHRTYVNGVIVAPQAPLFPVEHLKSIPLKKTQSLLIKPTQSRFIRIVNFTAMFMAFILHIALLFITFSIAHEIDE